MGWSGEGIKAKGSQPQPRRDYISQGASVAAVAAGAAGAATSPGSGARDFHSCVRRAEPETKPEAEVGI